ncbi:MAG: FAD-dependent monooxygenase [Chromatiales bacterium]|nr:FAD-dependent monooxygenase [Chromatiales bacterium]
MSAVEVDVLVAGAGPVGLAFALLLEQQCPALRSQRLRLALLDRRAAPSPPDGPELRVLALSPASRRLLEACGAWDSLAAGRLYPYEDMQVWASTGQPGARHSICFSAAELGVPALGWIAGADALRHALWSVLPMNSGLSVVLGEPSALEAGPEAISVTLANGHEIRTRLLVGADGASSWVRERLGVPSGASPYDQLAIVGRVRCEQPHRSTAWQRFAPGGPLALLPQDAQACSIVWSRPQEEARRLLALDDQAFAAELTEASGHCLGALSPEGPRAGFPLSRAHADHYTGARFALLGDAAHRVHPLAGQGVNLGLLDAGALAESLADALADPFSDPGDWRALRRYERERRGPNLATLVALDGLHQLFAAPAGPLRLAGAAGLGLVDQLRPVKHALARVALGEGHDLPRAARAVSDQRS